MKLTTLSALLVSAVLATACKKKEEPAPAVTPPPVPTHVAGSNAVTPPPADPGTPPAPTAPAADPIVAAGPDYSKLPAGTADFIAVLATHAEPKPLDPVLVKIESFKVVKADFDPAKIEGGTAEIELDLNSLKTDSEKRDGHLKTPDYLDVAQFATAKVKVENVKNKADKTYTADATVNVHGIEKKFPIEFTVVDATADSIKVWVNHTFSRLDFGIGKDSPDPKVEGVAQELTLRALLTLKKT